MLLWDDAFLAQAGEEVEEAVVGGLVVEEAQLAALAHVGDDFDGAAEVGVGVPGGGEVVEVGFDEVVGVGDVCAMMGAASASCCSSGVPWPGKGAGSMPNQAARRDHIQFQRKTSPLTTLKAWSRAAGWLRPIRDDGREGGRRSCR